MIPTVSGVISGAALMGSVVIGGAIASRRNRNRARRNKNRARLPESPSYVDRCIDFTKANDEYYKLLAHFEDSLSKDQLGKLFELKAKANDVQIKWQLCESAKTNLYL